MGEPKDSILDFVKEAFEKFNAVIHSSQWKVFDEVSRASSLFGSMLCAHALRMDYDFKVSEREFRGTLEAWKANRELRKLGAFCVNCAGFGQGLGRSGLRETARLAVDYLREISDFLADASFSIAANGFYHLGSTANTIGDTSSAVDGFTRALNISRSRGMDSLAGKSCFYLGRLFLEAGQAGEAADYLNHCLQLFPQHRKARVLLEEINNKAKK